MSDKKQTPISITKEKKEKLSPTQSLIEKTLEFKRLYQEISGGDAEKFLQTINDFSQERKKQKSPSDFSLIQIVQAVLHKAIRHNYNIKPFLQFNNIKKTEQKKQLLRDLAIYAVRYNKPKAIAPIASALQLIGIHVDHIGVGNEPPIPLINWSIQQPGYSAVTQALLEAGSHTYTIKGLISSQQHISKPLEDIGDFPGSLALAIKRHEPNENNQSTVISTMISRATPKDISDSIDLLDAFALNKKDADFAIMRQLLNKSEKSCILTALNLLAKTQNLQTYSNKEVLRDFILECIKEDQLKPSWKQTGESCMKIANSLKDQNIITALMQAGIPRSSPGLFDSLKNAFFWGSSSTSDESRSEPLLTLEDKKGQKTSSQYGSTEQPARPTRGMTINGNRED